MQLYVLDRAKNTLATTASFYNDKHHKELTAGASIFEFTIDKSDSTAQYMTTGNYLVFQDDRGRAWSFTILSYDETQTTKTVAAEDVSIELLNKAMDVWNTDQAYPFSYYFDLVTKDTPWTLGVNQLTDLSRKLVYTGRDTGLGRLLSVLKGFDNAECQFNIKVAQNKPVEFIVDVYKSIGTVQDNIQIVYNNELADIKKTESRAQFVTALAGVGGLVENQETTDPGLEKHIDFTDIDYKDDNFVSPKGDKFLRAVTANRTFNPGTTTYIEDFYDYDTQSAQELLNRTLTQLKERSEPQYTYDADVKIIDPTLDIGDTVTIIDHDYNPALYLQARVATLDKSYTDPTQGAITFCNYRVLNSSLSDQLRAMQNIIDQLPTSASIKVINNNIVQMIADNTELKKQVTFALQSADGKNVNYYGPDKPIQPHAGDIWFTQNGDKQVMMIYRDGQWHELASDMTGEEIKSKVAEAFANDEALQKRADDNDTKIADNDTKTDAAVSTANQAVSAAGFANDAAYQAKTAAANAQADAANALSGTSLAQQDATKALASAQAALTSVTAANDTANRADSSASAAQASAQAAIKSAQTALSMASGADAKAEAAAKVATTADSNATDALSGANIALDSAATALNQARSAGSAATSTAIIAKSNQSAISTLATKASVNTLTSQVASTATLQKQTADELLSKADSSVVDSLTSTANSTSTLATQTATALKSKAEISTVNTVNSTATSAATLATQTATTLKSKADSTTVDKLTGRVSSAESKLTQTATKAELALTNTDVDKLNDTVASQGLDITATADALKLKADSSTLSDLTDTVADNSAQLALTATKAELALTQNDIDDLGDTVSNQGVKLAATATAAELAATQDNVDTLKKTVTNNTAGVTANAKQIALKANQTDVDTLKGTVTSQGAQVAVTASQVALKADTATVNDLGKTVASQGAQLSLTATEVDLEAAQSAVDAVTKTATSNAAGIATNANAIKLKADSSTVSTLDGRVSTLSGQLDVQANLISAKVTANDVTGMLGNYATQSWSEGKISAAKNEITASVETVKQTVDNLQIASRNLARGTQNWNGATFSYQNVQVIDEVFMGTQIANDHGSAWQDARYAIADLIDRGLVINNQDYTLSVWCRLKLIDETTTDYAKAEVMFYGSNTSKTGAVIINDLGTSWRRISITFRFTGSSQTGRLRFERPSADGLTYLQQAGFTLNLGNKDLGWQPAPEDMASQDWTKSLLDVSEGKVSAQVQSVKTDLTNTANTLNNNIANATAGMATQTWTQGKLDLTADGLTSQISSVQDGLNTKYTSLEQTLKGVQITANNAATQGQLSLLSDQLTSTISGISVGGTNLYLDTKSFVNPGVWSNYANRFWTKQPDRYNGLAVMQTTGDWNGLSQYVKVKTGEVYTFSVYARCTSGTGTSYIYWLLNADPESGHARAQASPSNKLVNLSENWQRISVTTTITADGYILPRLERTANNDNPLQIAGLKLESGNLLTAWAPAPEDQATVADVSSQITQLQNDINLRVKTGDFASAMLNINDQINARVQTDDFLGAMLNISNSIDLQVYNAKNGNLLRNSEFITDKYWTKTGNHGFLAFDPTTSNTGVPTIWLIATGAGAKTGGKLTTEFKADGLKNHDKVTLSFYALGTAGTQLTFTLNGTTLDTYAVTLSATRTYYTLSLIYDTGNKLSIFADRADQSIMIDSLMLVKGDTALPWEPAGDNILTRIYMDDSDVLIQGKHIHLDGETTIDDAIIKSAMIDTVSANKLTAGTIDANEINVIHINGQNITANSITGDKLSADAIQVGLNNLSSVIRLNPTSLDFYDAGRRSMSLQDDGMHIIDYLNGEDVGLIHINRIDGHDNVNGLQFDLNKNGDYMAWGQRSDDTSLYTIKMGWFSSYGASQANFNPGFNFKDDVTFNNLIKINSDLGLRFTSIKYHDNYYASLTNANRKAGILFGGTELYFMRNDHVISLADILSKLGFVI